MVKEHAGCVPEVQRVSTAASSPLHGAFKLEFRGYPTFPIPFNASAAEVEAALEAIPTVGDVVVTSWRHPDPGLAPGLVTRAWDVTFTGLGSPANLGDLPALVPDGSGLYGSLVALGAAEVKPGCCAVELSFNGGADFTASGVALGVTPRPVVRPPPPLLLPSPYSPLIPLARPWYCGASSSASLSLTCALRPHPRAIK